MCVKVIVGHRRKGISETVFYDLQYNSMKEFSEQWQSQFPALRTLGQISIMSLR